MSGSQFVLDTNAAINYLNDRISLPDDNDAELFVSIITELELFAKPTMTSEEEAKIAAFLKDNVTLMGRRKAMAGKQTKLSAHGFTGIC